MVAYFDEAGSRAGNAEENDCPSVRIFQRQVCGVTTDWNLNVAQNLERQPTNSRTLKATPEKGGLFTRLRIQLYCAALVLLKYDRSELENACRLV